MARRPTLDELAAQVRTLTRKVAALERGAGRGRARPRAPVPAAAGGDDLLKLVSGRRGEPWEEGDRRGAVVYGGDVAIAGATYLWGIERPVPGLLDLDPVGPAEVLAALAHPHRLRLLVALVEKPRTAAELQKIIGARSAGPLYHHLRDLRAIGIISQRERLYGVPARHVVPILAALAIAIDLGARRGEEPADDGGQA